MDSPGGFNLRQLVQKVRDETGSVDPGEIAGKVLAQTPEEHLREAYETTLRDYVRHVIVAPRQGSAGGASGRSTKVAATREWWRGMLDQPVHVATGWKSLAECTRDDLLFACAERRKVAEQNIAWAGRFEKLAQSMGKLKAATVADLPNDLLAHGLGSTA